MDPTSSRANNHMMTTTTCRGPLTPTVGTSGTTGDAEWGAVTLSSKSLLSYGGSNNNRCCCEGAAATASSTIPWFVLPFLLFLQFGMAFYFAEDDDLAQQYQHVRLSTVNGSIVLFLLVSHVFRRLLRARVAANVSGTNTSHADDGSTGITTTTTTTKALLMLPDIIMDVLLALVFVDRVALALNAMVTSIAVFSVYILMQTQWKQLFVILLGRAGSSSEKAATTSQDEDNMMMMMMMGGEEDQKTSAACSRMSLFYCDVYDL